MRLLALTHLGLRTAPRELEAQAREVFPDTVVPRDFDIIVIPLPERGAAATRAAGGPARPTCDAAPPEVPDDVPREVCR